MRRACESELKIIEIDKRIKAGETSKGMLKERNKHVKTAHLYTNLLHRKLSNEKLQNDHIA